MTLLDLTPRAVENDRLATLPVAIIGAGPIGLAAAAHLLERGIDFVIFEAGDQAAASVRAWGHTRLFSPWKHLVDPASRRLLEAQGWELPDPERAPTGAELVEKYVAPLAALEPIASRMRTGVEVSASPAREWTAPARVHASPRRSRSVSAPPTERSRTSPLAR